MCQAGGQDTEFRLAHVRAGVVWSVCTCCLVCQFVDSVCMFVAVVVALCAAFGYCSDNCNCYVTNYVRLRRSLVYSAVVCSRIKGARVNMYSGISSFCCWQCQCVDSVCMCVAVVVALCAAFVYCSDNCNCYVTNYVRLRRSLVYSTHHHHHVTQSSHSINAIGPAPLWSGRKREHCSIMFVTITHIPSLHKILVYSTVVCSRIKGARVNMYSGITSFCCWQCQCLLYWLPDTDLGGCVSLNEPPLAAFSFCFGMSWQGQGECNFCKVLLICVWFNFLVMLWLDWVT
jgi:hypothetical protein